jgi:S-adenosylmethionine synthetase
MELECRLPSFGHFGRTGGEVGSFTWERLDLVDALRARLG